MKKNRVRSFLLHLTGAFFLTACTLGPDFDRPSVELPGQYRQTPPNESSVSSVSWQQLFVDETLNQLISIALSENRDLRIAVARIDEARGLLGFTRADQLPKVDGSANVGRADASNEIFNFSPSPRNSFGLIANLSFELDLWGKLRSATEAQRAGLLATEFGKSAVQSALIGQVAMAYIKIVSADDRLLIAQRTIKNRGQSTKIIRDRFSKGVIPELDVNQAEIEEQQARITALTIERERQLAENALSVLLGRAQYHLPSGATLESLRLTCDVPASFPAALLNQRPDVLSAEQLLRAEIARISIAEAQRLPSLNLFGSIGLQSSDSSDLLSRNALAWSGGGGLLTPLIDFGKNKSRVAIAEARAQQASLQYEQTVLQAVREVEDALVTIRTVGQEHGYRIAQVKSSSNAARLSRARYDEGVTSYVEVLDIERSLFQAELGKAQTKEQYLSGIVQLYRALGGGWREEDTANTRKTP